MQPVEERGEGNGEGKGRAYKDNREVAFSFYYLTSVTKFLSCVEVSFFQELTVCL